MENIGTRPVVPAPAFNPTPSDYRSPQQTAADRLRLDRERELRRFNNGDIKYADLIHPENRQLVDQWRKSAARQRVEDERNRIENEKIRASRQPAVAEPEPEPSIDTRLAEIRGFLDNPLRRRHPASFGMQQQEIDTLHRVVLALVERIEALESK